MPEAIKRLERPLLIGFVDQGATGISFPGSFKRRSKTFYGVTTQRAIIVSGIFSRNVKSLELSSLGGLSLSEQRDRSGTITLGPPSGLYAWAAGLAGPSWPGAARYLPPAFEMIENARQVHEQIRSIQARDR